MSVDFFLKKQRIKRPYKLNIISYHIFARLKINKDTSEEISTKLSDLLITKEEKHDFR